MKKTFLLICTLLVSSVVFALGHDFDVDGILYKRINHSVVSVSCIFPSYYSGDVTIPSEIKYNGITYAVTSIEPWAFAYCSNLQSVTIPSTITSVGSEAFTDCPSLQYNIYENAKYLGNERNPYHVFIECIDKSVSSCIIHKDTKIIYSGAFYGYQNLTTINIPEGVTSIGSSAFSYCSSLTSITIPNSVTYIGIYTCMGSKNVQYNICDNNKYLGNETNPYHALLEGSITLHDNTKVIAGESFYVSKDSTEFSLPDGLIGIGEVGIRGGSNVKTLVLPSTLTYLDEYALTWFPKLETIKLKEGNSTFHVKDNCLIETASKTLVQGCKTSVIPQDGSVLIIGDHAFECCYDLPKIYIPDCIDIIGNSAFYHCNNATEVHIGAGVTIIGDLAFDMCTSLTEVTIPYGVTEIRDQAFCQCKGLTSIDIPETVTKIGRVAFANCENLEYVRFNSPYPPIIEESVFHSNTKILVPCGGVEYYQNILYGSVVYEEPFYFSGCSITSVDETKGTIQVLQSNVCFDNTIVVEAVPAYGCYFTEWNDGNTENPRTIIVTAGTEYTAFFERDDYTISVVSNNTEWGTVTGSGDYLNGKIITITAQPAEGYKFVEWNDGNTNRIRSIRVTKDSTFTAYFALDDYTISVTTNNVEWGTVTGSGDYVKNTEATVTAIPADGYRFTHWNDGNTENPRILQVTQDTTFTAYFATVFTDIQLKQTQLTLEVGDSYYLNTIIEPKDADKSKLIWSSSNEDIVSVDGCIATAHQIGTATITVRTEDNALSATCEIVVVEEGQNASDDVVVDPNDKSVEISWTPVEGAAYYVFVVYADESQVTKICTLTFNAWGFLTNIHFLPKKPALTPENNPFNFTVTGLEENTTYGYSMSSYNEEETLITSKAGQFTTTSNVATSVETPYIASPDEVRKVLENGTICILRNGEKYTIDGRKVE